MDPLHHLPLSEIAPHALLRDRTALEPSALHLLQHSIATEGLRTPIEVWQLSTPREQHKYGLISGLRRLTACRALGHTTIPAFLRAPQTIAQALASMVTENEIREPVTPWEKATLILNAIHEGHFDTPDTAIAALFPALPRTTRTRIRNHVSVVEALAPLLTDPTSLTTRQLDTLAAALQSGHEDLLTATLHPVMGQGSETQWSTLRPVLLDVLREPTNPTTRRPRRLLKLRQGLTITREPTPSGWLLRFSGPQARSGLIDDVLDKVEEWFGEV
ncbi:MAG: ParB N-terminal domain-containing protein [Tabrizicola sp.]|uniref:ParB/RepB/Spo0J family partition protein n=1 Tax=Tabrizicola sp. TaxID=2005166 RepID=UPI0027325C52|nr:ParB N-terminal domain-containing protein [Tabrizicola sp.]MDP3262014.1 ParB N-terminal domain-containing protein [Tabrizicola sp.]